VLDAVRRYEKVVGPWWKPAGILERLAAEGGKFNA
jgi:hypothetical protein